MDFTWKGTTASSHGIVVTLLPNIVSAAMRDETVAIPFRSGLLHMQDGAAEDVLKTCSVYLPYEQVNTVDDLKAIKSWLTGCGEVSFDNDPGHVYRGRIVSQIEWTEWIPGWNDREGQIIWTCEPYAYHTNVQNINVTASGTRITNPGTAEALPLIAVTGSGDVEVLIGSQIVMLDGLTGTVYIDCEAQEAYVMSGQVRISANDKMAGDFPSIPAGTSQISWVGNVSKVTITPRWRDF